MAKKNPSTFLFGKEKTWRRIVFTKSELSQNHTEKQIVPSGYLMIIWCYLFLSCFDWQIVVFQQNSCNGLLYP